MGESDVRGNEGSGPRPAGHQHFMIIIGEQVYNLFLISGGQYRKMKLMMSTSVDKVNVLLHTKVAFIICHEGWRCLKRWSYYELTEDCVWGVLSCDENCSAYRSDWVYVSRGGWVILWSNTLVL